MGNTCRCCAAAQRPIFLFVSGYLTALSGRVPLWKQIKIVLIPYVFAFIAAYIYMALHNPAINHHIPVVIARFALAYVFVYYYVFVYIGCVIGLWIIMRVSRIFEIEFKSAACHSFDARYRDRSDGGQLP